MEPAAADVVGRTLGEFTLREKIGQGAFGAVYRAVQTSLGREAVVKILQPKTGGAAGTAKVRFLREARLASRLDHPYAAHIYAFGAEDDGTLWIAMELVRGTSLADLIRAQGAIPVDRAVPLLERICEVVENAHEHGIVHRDLKPANIMIITRGGRLFPKLLDLGLAKIVEAPEDAPRAKAGDVPAGAGVADTMRSGVDEGQVAVTQRGAYIGTPLYMAPEQWTQGAIDARADQYALGCVAYECLVGKPPFVGRSVIEVARAHQSAALPALPGGVPGKMFDVIQRAVAKKAPERWETVLRFATALRDAAGLGGDSPLPEIDEALRRVALDAPAPIAEAAAAIEAARNPHEARDAVLRTVRVTLRWLAIIGLAGRTRGGVEATGAGQLVADLLRELRKRELDERDWVELISALVKPYAEKPEVHAIPEFVRAAHAGIPGKLAKLIDEIQPTREALAAAYVELSVALREMTFLRDYALVVPRGPIAAEIWMGARRTSRPSVELAAGVPEGDGRPVLADADRRPVLVLWPLAQLAAPSPGAPEELFLLEGYGRRGARLVGGAVGFERQDEGVWDYFRQSILDESLIDSGPRLEVAPYRGLAPFTAEDARMFYGREREAEAFANRLKVQSLLVVAGPSGVGKSSFVQAGVAPSLPEGSQVVVVRPGSTPLATLEARLGGESPAMLVVDQFEELITLCGDPAEREAYAAKLVALSRSSKVVLTVRDDFLARIAELPSLRDRVTQGLHLLTTPAEEDLLRILLEPARKAGYEFDPRELPDKMMSEVAGRPGALALLSFTASKLWEARDRHFRRLTGAAYDAMGGVGGALARHADETLAQLPAAEQRLVREAFRHLVTSEGTRAVLTPKELRQLLGGGAAAERVIETLIGARLLVSDEERVEIIHEALVVAWPRLVEWRREDAEGSRFRDQLRTAVKAWDERGRPTGLLWRGDALADYQRWRAGYEGGLTEAEEAFTGASVEEARRSTRNRRVVIATAIVGLVVAVVVLLFLYRRAEQNEALAKVSEEESRRNSAVARERMLDSYEEQGRQYFLNGDPLRGTPVLLQAWEEGRRSVAVRYLLARGREAISKQRLNWSHDADVLSLRMSPDFRLVAAGSMSGRVRVWNAVTGQRLHDLAAHTTGAMTVRFSPDGRLLASGGWDGKVRLWDLGTGTTVRELAHDDRVYSAQFSTEGNHLVTASWDKTAKLWNVADGRLVATLTHDAKLDLATFVPGSGEILTADHKGRARVWDATGQRVVRTMTAPEERLREWAFDGGGRHLVLAGDKENVTTWSLATGTRLAELRHPSTVTAADLDLDGKQVVTASADRMARLWNAQTGELLLTVVGVAPLKRARFCGPNAIVTGADDGTIELWRRDDGQLLDTFSGHLHSVYMLDCDPTGNVIASGAWDETVRVWRGQLARTQPLATVGERPSSFDILPNGKIWAIARKEQTTTIWREGGSLPFAEVPRGKGASVDVRLGHDGSRVVTFGKSDAPQIWSLPGSPTPVTLVGHEGPVTSVAFRFDDRRVATAGEDGTARVWDPNTGRLILTIKAHDQRVNRLAFSPDGNLLATCSNDQTAAVWDLGTGELRSRLKGHSGNVQDITFDHSVERVMTASSDRTLRIWDVSSGRSVMVLEGHAKGVNQARFAGDLIVSGDYEGEVRMWDRTSGRLLEVLPGAGAFIIKLVSGPGWIVVGSERGVIRWDIGLLDEAAEIAWGDDCRLPYFWDHGRLSRRSFTECPERPLN